ncbi:MAG: hypothetical protein EWM72_03102 [Nitrospira sp.]|nr:MAG: hypothetical protein EWM72_03102 [Nitrospira sp.]
MFLVGNQFVASFGKPARPAVWWTGLAVAFEHWEAIRVSLTRRRIPAEFALEWDGRFGVGLRQALGMGRYSPGAHADQK